MCLAVPAKILSIDGFTAEVDFGGVHRQISLQLLPEAQVGDYVLIHTGFAIGVVDPEEARMTLEMLREMSEMDPLSADGAIPTYTGYSDGAVP
ncbi:MAG TPA: HypC/HybG/HupF family hydrogenase formation chaperone [Anaerolineae bacterium]|nr:HypC/HybG/HupF family hydrogenase formation chaperone [Anaerolineae bacterium]